MMNNVRNQKSLQMISDLKLKNVELQKKNKELVINEQQMYQKVTDLQSNVSQLKVQNNGLLANGDRNGTENDKVLSEFMEYIASWAEYEEDVICNDHYKEPMVEEKEELVTAVVEEQKFNNMSMNVSELFPKSQTIDLVGNAFDSQMTVSDFEDKDVQSTNIASDVDIVMGSMRNEVQSFGVQSKSTSPEINANMNISNLMESVNKNQQIIDRFAAKFSFPSLSASVSADKTLSAKGSGSGNGRFMNVGSCISPLRSADGLNVKKSESEDGRYSTMSMDLSVKSAQMGSEKTRKSSIFASAFF